VESSAITSSQDTRVSNLSGASIGLSGAVVQSAALIAPAVGATAGFVFIAGQSGFAAPFAMVIGMLISLCVAVVIGDYARKLPAAGSFYNYLTAAFGPKTGFVTGFMLFGAYVLLLPFQLSFFGNYAATYFDAQGFHLAWQWWALALILVTTTLCAVGLSPSLKVGLLGLTFEVLVFGTVSIVVLVNGGDAGLSLKPFDPSESALGFSGIIYGLVFAIFAFVGFESSTTLGEEVHEPRRTIPRAVLVTTVVIGLFYTLLMYVGVVGFGISAPGLEALQSDGAPFNTLAQTFAGSWLSTLVTISVMTSFLALNIVTVTAASRMIYSMGRDRMLPAWFDHVNARRSPGRAALAVGIFGAAVTLIFGSAYTPGESAEWGSYIATLFFIVAYALLIVGVVRLYRTKYKDEFSLLRHVAIPIAGIVGVGIVAYGNVHPLPPSPLRYFIWATLAVAVLSALVSIWLERRDPEKLVTAGQLFAAATPEEADVRDDVPAFIPEPPQPREPA
jgi:amino acid transporter